ncbi:MAG: MFS transporter [Actinomycetota bacterium]
MSEEGTGTSRPPAWRSVVAWAGAPLIIGALNEFALHVSVPVVRDEFGLEVTQAGWMLLAFLIADAAVLIAAGRLGDRFGRRRIAVIGLGLVIIGSGICAVAPNFSILLTGRVIEGIGVGAVFSGLLAIIVDAVPQDSRGRAFGIGALIGAVAFLASPLLGGLLTEQLSWRWVFILNALIGLAALLTARRFIPSQSGHSGGPTAGPARLVACTNFVAGTTVMTLVYATVALTWLLLVFLLTSAAGLGPTSVGLMIVAYAVWWLVLPPFTGRLADRVGVRKPMLIGGAVGVVGYATLALSAGSGNLLLIGCALALIGIGVSFLIPPSNAASMGHVPPQIRGDASGVNMTARIVGSIAGLAVSTVLLDSLEPGDVMASAQTAWIIATVLMLLAVIVSAFAIRVQEVRADPISADS